MVGGTALVSFEERGVLLHEFFGGVCQRQAGGISRRPNGSHRGATEPSRGVVPGDASARIRKRPRSCSPKQSIFGATSQSKHGSNELACTGPSR
jgi:hypothetical protein